MKSRSEIWFAVLAEAGTACSVNTTLDRKTVERRVAAEGDSFFTVTLPKFEKELIQSISNGRIHADAFPGFERSVVRDVQSGLSYRGRPKFLGGFLDLLFCSRRGVLDVETGLWHDEIVPEPVWTPMDPTDLDPRVPMALKSLRQLCLLFSKEKDLCDPERVEQAIESYVLTDKHVIDPLATSEETFFSRVVFSRMLRESCPLSLEMSSHLWTVRSTEES